MKENNNVQDEQEKINKKKRVKLKNVINITIIAVIFIALIVYMLVVDGWDNIVNILKTVDYRWVLGGLLCIIVYWLLESVGIYIPSKKMYKNQKFFNSIKISMVGQLFSAITPFSSGGQPVQAYLMTRENKSISNCATILLIKFLVSQIVLLVYTGVVVILQFSYFQSVVQNFLPVAILGFGINIIVIVFLILVGINEKLVFSLLKPIYHLLGKMKIFKNVDERLDKLKTSITNFHNQFQIIRKEKMMIFKMVIVTFVQHSAYFMVTYMVYRALGNSGANFFNIITAQSFLLLIMAITPTPGAGLAAEGGFLALFNSIFKAGTINMSMLFWRMYTFYLQIIVGAIFLLFYKKKEHIDIEEAEVTEI